KTDYKIHIYAVGRVGSPANRMESHDGGITWTSHSMENDCKMLFDITMFDTSTASYARLPTKTSPYRTRSF
ncbi:MAG: hypothetical protein ACKO7B_08370, partial [Flavobacteriales bacterium]